jgi:hypothetical protein
MDNADEGWTVVGGDLIHIAHGFAVGLEGGHLPALGIGAHELAQLLTGENLLLDFFR